MQHPPSASSPRTDWPSHPHAARDSLQDDPDDGAGAGTGPTAALRARASRFAVGRGAAPAGLLARMLVVALGLLGLVGGHGPHTAASGASGTPTSVAGTGLRTGAVQGVPTRGRPAHAGLASRAGRAEHGNVRHAEAALARQTVELWAPLWQTAPPPPDAAVRPPNGRTVRPAPAPDRPAAEPRGVPRGRAPPVPARI